MIKMVTKIKYAALSGRTGGSASALRCDYRCGRGTRTGFMYGKPLAAALAMAFLIAALFLPWDVTAATEAVKMVSTKVTSDKMVYESNANRVVFSGRVKVVNPDFTMTSERMTLLLSSGKGGAKSSSNPAQLDSGKVKTIVAERNVVIKMEGGRQANCGKATYEVAEDTLRMEGSPVLLEEGSKASGDVIVFYLGPQKVEVLGGASIDISTPEKPRSGAQPLTGNK